MPVLITSETTSFTSKTGDDCSSTYKAFDDSRKPHIIQYADLNPKVKRFKSKVITKLPECKIGEYCLFKVSELKSLMAMAEGAEYIQVHNGMDAKGFGVMFITPLGSDYKLLNKDTTIIIEAFPCPPHPSCPTNPIYSDQENKELFDSFGEVTPKEGEVQK